jgi:hypothetical protein
VHVSVASADEKSTVVTANAATSAAPALTSVVEPSVPQDESKKRSREAEVGDKDKASKKAKKVEDAEKNARTLFVGNLPVTIVQKVVDDVGSPRERF